MIKVNSDQITSKLDQLKLKKKLVPYFFLVGTESYLQNVVENNISQYLKSFDFLERSIFSIDTNTDWDSIYSNFQDLSLFTNRTIVILRFGENGVNASMTAKLNGLVPLLNDDTAILLSIGKITKPQENTEWFKRLSENSLWINCTTPDLNTLPQWITAHAQQQKIKLEQEAIELLCYYYEGNLLSLVQALEQLKFLYPGKKLSLSQVEQNVNDAAIFTPYHWIDAILAGKSNRALHILKQFEINDVEPLMLLRTFQRELLQLINLKRSSQKNSLRAAMDEYKVWQSRRNLLSDALNRLSQQDLANALHKLAQIEVSLKQDYSTVIWDDLSSLSLLMMRKAIVKKEHH